MVNENSVDYSEQSDESLMSSFQNGNEKAYTELYGRYFDKLVNFCFYIKRGHGRWGHIDEDSLEDISQKALINAYYKKNKYHPKNNFRNWLFTITRNLLITEYRKKIAGPGIDYLEKIVYDGGKGNPILLKDKIEEENLTEELNFLENGWLVKGLLKKLSKEKPELYIPIKLYYNYDFKYSAISERMGISMSSVKSRIFRGKKMIKKYAKKFNAKLK